VELFRESTWESKHQIIDQNCKQNYFTGGIFLAVVALLPTILNISPTFLTSGFGGTALLIVVGVAIETNNQIQSQMLMRHYKWFFCNNI
jgi:preprotein translocase subunit SecY